MDFNAIECAARVRTWRMCVCVYFHSFPMNLYVRALCGVCSEYARQEIKIPICHWNFNRFAVVMQERASDRFLSRSRFVSASHFNLVDAMFQAPRKCSTKWIIYTITTKAAYLLRGLTHFPTGFFGMGGKMIMDIIWTHRHSSFACSMPKIMIVEPRSLDEGARKAFSVQLNTFYECPLEMSILDYFTAEWCNKTLNVYYKCSI